MKNMSRRDISDSILEKVNDYLEDAKWILCNHTLFWIDPVTSTKHNTITAFSIQIDRDLNLE